MLCAPYAAMELAVNNDQCGTAVHIIFGGCPIELQYIHQYSPRMAEFSFNLEAYVDRIGLTDRFPRDGSGAVTLTPDMETLSALQLAHMKTVTFENLDVVAKKRISMLHSDVEQKLVKNKRGGYCFEQSTLMQDALRKVGFSVDPLLARVRWMKPDDVRTTFTHMVLIVRIPGVEGEYLVDVGFGGIGPLSPIRVDITEPQQSIEGQYRVVPCGEYPGSDAGSGKYRLLQWFLQDKWQDLYAMKMDPVDYVDLELSNWWSCSNPTARFPTSLFVGILVGFDRHFILNDAYCIRKQDGSITREPINGFAHFCELLTTVFNLPVPEGSDFEAGALRFLSPPASS
jgi:N-hydroxyarylamine O-acetyltransferase